MKTLLLGLLVVLGSLTLGGVGGCATPAYSAHERGQMIARNWGYEWRQISDDVDTILLLRPGGTLTLWHIQ
jgi:hypothetical protein